MNGARRVLMLGLDAADREVVIELAHRGELPNLKRIIDSGLFGPLASPAAHYAGGVWPSFYTGQRVPWHGVFHNKLWRPEAMRVEVPGEDWLTARPFWESLSAAGIDSCIVDVPMVLGRPRPIRGVNLAGWGTHDLICTGSWPGALWRGLERRFGTPRMPKEHFGRQTPASLGRLRRQLLDTTDQLRDVGIELLASHPWQFACIVFGAIHRAGHYLWDLSQVDSPPGRGDDPLRSAMVDVYRNADAAVGGILERVPDETLVVVFAVHGMAANPGWSDLFPDMLAGLEAAATGRPPKRGLVYALKRRLPYHWVRPVLSALPPAVTDRLVPLWSRHMFDWSHTRYFPMPMDEAGYLRVNLRGREAEGIVAPGAEYEALCDRIEAQVAGLFDEATGEPLAGEILRAWRDAGTDAPARGLLPDLVVPWRAPFAAGTRRVRSRASPEFCYDVPAQLPSGRSGNHTANAWFAATGPGVRRGRLSGTHDIIDLAPTVRRYLSLEPDPALQGRAIDLGTDE